MHPPKDDGRTRSSGGGIRACSRNGPNCRTGFVLARGALTCTPWALSSVGRASPLQGEGRGIETRSAHVKAGGLASCLVLRRSRVKPTSQSQA